MLCTCSRLMRGFARQQKNFAKKPKTQTNKNHASGSRNDQINTSSQFPYKFNGVKSYLQTTDDKFEALKTDTECLTQLYKNFLQAVNDKNQKQLSDIIEPSLVQPLINHKQEFRLIDQKAPVQLLQHSSSVGLGATFPRDFQQTYYKHYFLTIKSFVYLLENNRRKEGSIFSIFTSGCPVLISINATVLSKARLALANDSQALEEAHSVTFQYYSRFTLFELRKAIRLYDNLTVQQAVYKYLFSKKQKWRIGNIDHFLKDRYE